MSFVAVHAFQSAHSVSKEVEAPFHVQPIAFLAAARRAGSLPGLARPFTSLPAAADALPAGPAPEPPLLHAASTIPMATTPPIALMFIGPSLLFGRSPARSRA